MSDEPGQEAASVGLRRVSVQRRDGEDSEPDWVAVEEPLEIRIGGESFAVTMRTPGHDRELAAGFLFTEGVLRRRVDLRLLEKRHDLADYDPDNVVDVELSSEAASRTEALDAARRDLTATAACGLCGKARIEAVYQRLPVIPRATKAVALELLRGLPDRMREGQRLFERTGGLHAAALFRLDGSLVALREDVGRHNAVDKLVGRSLLNDELPWHDRILVTSGRAGFEVVQKALMAAVPTVVAVGAASTLSVEAAGRGGLDLYTFVRSDRSVRHVRPGIALASK
ncbi:MAG: formate dehydrogenase accessory sulfurtransferase FdhD [Thermoanaerobaculia bacterium]|nr:formate dehydrogenase accessory sulfurtransferase FdhD [Thermoanaerobaculia bacterium]